MPRSKIVENTVSLSVSGAGGLVFTLVQLSILSRFLEGESFGVFVALRGFSILLGTLILLGLPQVIIRFFPSYQTRGSRGRALGLFFFSTGVVAVLGLLLYLGAGRLVSFVPSGIRSLSFFRQALPWLALASCALAAKMLLYGGFNGLREMRMQMILELLYLSMLTVFIFAERNVLDVVLLFKAIFIFNASVFVIGLPGFIVFARRLIRESEGAGYEGLVLPSLLPYWFGSLLMSLVALAFSDVDRFVMSSVLPVAAVSIFHIASRVNLLIRRFLGIPLLAAQPEITRVYEEGRGGGLKGDIRLFTKSALIASLFVSGLVAVVGRDVITLLSGREYADAYPILLVLLPTVPIAAVAGPLLAAMRSLHYMRWAVLCDFVWMVAYFGSFFLLVSFLGVTGMAVAQIVAGLVQMASAVLLSRREGLYGGVGSRLKRVIVVLLLAVPAGMLITGLGGLPVSIAFVVAAPVLFRFLLKRLNVFEEREKERMLGLIKLAPARKTASWMLSVEAQ